MQSSGGMATVEAARERPVNLLMSGPVAGLSAGSGRAGWPATRTSSRSTWAAPPPTSASPPAASCACATCSTRRSATTRRWCRWSTSTRSARAEARSPTWTRAASSASARSRRAPIPGPACYGRGGDQPTSTDAQLLLGRLRPDRGLLGGDMSLDVELATRGDAARLRPARRPGRGGGARRAPGPEVLDGAGDRGQLGAPRVRPARVHARRGRRRGPAVRVRHRGRARDPARPGARRIRGSRRRPGCSRPTSSTSSSPRSATSCARSTATASAPAWTSSSAQAVAQLERDGVPEDRRLVRRLADCRYVGQGYEVRFDIPAGELDDGWAEPARGGVPRRARARVRAPVRCRGRDRQRPRARDRADSGAPVGRARGRRRRPGAGEDGRARGGLRRRGESRSAAPTPFYDRGAAAGGRPGRGAGDHRAVRLDDRDPARLRRRDRPLREHRDRLLAERSARSRRRSWRRRS